VGMMMIELTAETTYNNKYQCFSNMYFCGQIYSIPDSICRLCWTSKVLLCCLLHLY